MRTARRSTWTGCWRSASPPPPSRAAASVTAVIAAAGSGERLGAGGPKAFVSLSGRPMVEWSMAAFRACESVASIVVACPPGQLSEPGNEAVPDGGAGVLDGLGVEVVEGGATRSESVRNALAGVETELVAIHDAARPLITPELIAGVLFTLSGDPDAAGAIAATPVTDTIKRASSRARAAFPIAEEENAALVGETLDRTSLWAAQTPQAFRVEALRAALDAADSEGLAAATDEAMLVEATGGRVLIHPSPPQNLKVTTPLDLQLAELLLGERAG